MLWKTSLVNVLCPEAFPTCRYACLFLNAGKAFEKREILAGINGIVLNSFHVFTDLLEDLEKVLK